VAHGKFLFTSEAVSMAIPTSWPTKSPTHPRRPVCQGPHERVACETMVTTGIAIVAGEITSKAVIYYPSRPPGHPRGGLHRRQDGHLRRHVCHHALDRRQSPDIAMV